MPKNLTEKEYEQHLFRALAETSYFRFFRAYSLVIGKLESLFLQDLINRRMVADASKLKRKRPLIDEDGYFLCPVKFLQNFKHCLIWTDDEQRRHFKKLEELNFVRTKKIGMPPRRWVKINLHLIQREVETRIDEMLRKQAKIAQCRGKPRQRSSGFPRHLIEEENHTGFLNLKETMSHVPFSAADAASSCNDATTKKTLTTNSRDSFLPEQTNKESSVHLEWATALREGLRAKKIPVTNLRPIKSWAKEFRILERAVPAADIGKVLHWYIPRIGEDFVPQALCGKSFRLKFVKIQKAMEKDERENPDIELSAEMKNLANDLSRSYRWPKGSEEYLPLALARGEQEYLSVRKRFRAALDFPSNDPVRKFVANELLPQMGTVTSFLKNWMVALWKELSKWKEWNGSSVDFLRRSFSAKNEKFQNWGRTICIRYCGHGRYWDKLNEKE